MTSAAPPPPSSDPLNPPVLVAVSRRVLTEVLGPGTTGGHARLGRLLDATVDAVILGADLLTATPSAPDAAAGAGLDPSIAAIVLSRHTHRTGLVITAAPQRDHPYNLARRVSSLDHASHGRAGLALAAADPAATPGSPWTAADPGVAAADTAVALRELWHSFPADVIVADRESGIFAESERIVAVDHRGAFEITGPLQVPTSPQIWPPILAWGPTAPAELAAVADVVVDPAASDGEGRALFEIHQPQSGEELIELLTGLPELSRRLGLATLRDRLGLSAARPTTGGRVVFPAPVRAPAAVPTADERSDIGEVQHV